MTHRRTAAAWVWLAPCLLPVFPGAAAAQDAAKPAAKAAAPAAEKAAAKPAAPARAAVAIPAMRLAPPLPVGNVTVTTSAALGTAVPAAAAGPLTLDACWAELEKGEPEAVRALLWMARRPKESVPFLKDRLRPITLDEEQARYLVRRLADKNEKVWKKAYADLEYLDPRLAIDVVALFNEVAADDARPRLAALLLGREPEMFAGKKVSLQPFNNGVQGRQTNFLLQFQDDNGGINNWVVQGDLNQGLTTYGQKKGWNRAVRSELLLESIGTPDAVAVLKDMALGHAQAAPSRVAREALDRLAAATK